MALVERKVRVFIDSTYPTAGRWDVGDMIINSAPTTSGTPFAWVCTTAGNTGGTWVSVLPVKDQATITTVAAAAAVAVSAQIVDIDTGNFNVTLAAPASTTAGNTINLVNDNASPCTLVAASGTSIVGNVTLSANSSATVRNSGTVWYRI